MNTQLYSQEFKELSHTFYKWVFSKNLDGDTSNSTRSNQLSHEELVAGTLINVLADQYYDLGKNGRDGIILMLLENELLED